MKKYFVAAAVMAAFSGASFASDIEVTFSGTLAKVADCTIDAGNAAHAVVLGTVDINNLTAAVAQNTALVFTNCAVGQKISLAATSPAGAGTVDGRLATDGTATGVEIDFEIGGAKLPVGGAAAQVATNSAGVIANVSVPVVSKLVANGRAPLGAGTVASTLTLTASY